MGQYYTPVILNNDKTRIVAYAYSHNFGSGLKLMEHSWLNNAFVQLLEHYLINNPSRLVWAGDYADNEEGSEYNLYSKASEEGLPLSYPEMPTDEVMQYKYSSDKDESQKYWGIFERQSVPKKYKYIVNHDKKIYINKLNLTADSDGWFIHPLPLMTCEGNGRGGGDYRNENADDMIIGSWSRDLISIESRKPNKDYTEVVFNLT